MSVIALLHLHFGEGGVVEECGWLRLAIVMEVVHQRLSEVTHLCVQLMVEVASSGALGSQRHFIELVRTHRHVHCLPIAGHLPLPAIVWCLYLVLAVVILARSYQFPSCSVVGASVHLLRQYLGLAARSKVLLTTCVPLVYLCLSQERVVHLRLVLVLQAVVMRLTHCF